MHKIQFKKDLSRVFYVKSQEKHIEVPLACPPVPDAPVSTVVGISNPAMKRSFDVSRVTPALSSTAPVVPALTAGAVEPFMPSDNGLTMSSLKIVSLTGRQHKNVLADIRRILGAVGISPANFSAVYKDKQLIDRPCFNLPRRECDLVIEGYPAKYRPTIIDAWQELERQATRVSDRHLCANRVTPALPSAAPVTPVLAAGVVEPFISSDNSLTMSSLEIAELTGKDHKNVMADIRKMLAELGKAAADFSATAFIDGPNNSKRKIEIFNLPKRETLILVSGYSIAMRARIIDLRQEMLLF